MEEPAEDDEDEADTADNSQYHHQSSCPTVPVAYLFGRHEIRLAYKPVQGNDSFDNNVDADPRNSQAHITNNSHTQMHLLRDFEELVDHYDALEHFLCKIVHHLYPDLERRVRMAQSSYPPSFAPKFSLAGLDIMMTGDGRFYLLEVNVNPSVPKEDSVTPTYRQHLLGFWRDLMDTVLNEEGERREDNCFVETEVILEDGRNS